MRGSRNTVKTLNCKGVIITLSIIQKTKEKSKLTCASTFTAQQKFQLDRVHLQEVKRSSYEHTKKCADQLLLLGQVCITLHMLLTR